MEVVLYICEKLFRADADFLSVVISDTKGNLSEIFSFFFVSVLVITVLAQPLLVYVGGMKKRRGKAAAA